MLLRNVNERLQIISRRDCKNESEYNKKLFKSRTEYMEKYKSIVIIGDHTKETVKINSLELLQTKLEEI